MRAEFHTTLCALYSLLMLFNIEVLKHFQERGGGGGGKLVFGVRGNPRAPPLNETLVCVDSSVFCGFFFFLAG